MQRAAVVAGHETTAIRRVRSGTASAEIEAATAGVAPGGVARAPC